MPIDALVDQFWGKPRLLFDGGINRGEITNGGIDISHGEKTAVGFGKSGNHRALISAADHANAKIIALISDGWPKRFQWAQSLHECRGRSRRS